MSRTRLFALTTFVLTSSPRKVYDLGASWVAYESDDHTIRSGTFTAGINHDRAMSQKGQTFFSSAMVHAPRALFVGFDRIGAPGNANLRIDLKTSDKTEESFKWDFSTWKDESIVLEASASYVAIL